VEWINVAQYEILAAFVNKVTNFRVLELGISKLAERILFGSQEGFCSLGLLLSVIFISSRMPPLVVDIIPAHTLNDRDLMR
jgi:hypothetical protein